METSNNVLIDKKPVFKYAWEKLNTGDYTDIKEYTKAYKEWDKKRKQVTK
jgi:hypothetical protein